MAAFKAWLAKSRWAVWAVVGLLVVIVLAVLRSLLDVKPKSGQAPGLPPIPKVLQDKVDKAQEDNLRIRVETKVVAEEHKKELEAVMKLDDGAERRKRLAEMLGKL
jgi:hypothetical protein